MIDRAREEPLDRWRVHVDEDEAIDAGCRDDVGRHARPERAAARAPILPCVAEIRDDAREPLRAVTTAGIGKQQELDQAHVRGRTRRLDQEHVAAADRLAQLDLRLAVGESL